MKKRILAALLVSMMLVMGGCGEKVIVHCDGCNKEIEVDADSGIDEDWILFCDECDDDLE